VCLSLSLSPYIHLYVCAYSKGGVNQYILMYLSSLGTLLEFIHKIPWLKLSKYITVYHCEEFYFCVIQCCVVCWNSSDVSEEHVTSIFTVEEKASMKQAESCLKMAMTCSEMSVDFQQISWHIITTDVRTSSPTTYHHVWRREYMFYISTCAFELVGCVLSCCVLCCAAEHSVARDTVTNQHYTVLYPTR
jgi:hypothetical protein